MSTLVASSRFHTKHRPPTAPPPGGLSDSAPWRSLCLGDRVRFVFPVIARGREQTGGGRLNDQQPHTGAWSGRDHAAIFGVFTLMRYIGRTAYGERKWTKTISALTFQRLYQAWSRGSGASQFCGDVLRAVHGGEGSVDLGRVVVLDTEHFKSVIGLLIVFRQGLPMSGLRTFLT